VGAPTVSSETKTHFFSFSEKELEIANTFIRDGWQGDLPSLQHCVELLVRDMPLLESFRRKDE